MTLQRNPESHSGQLVDDENEGWYVNPDVKRLVIDGQVFIYAEEFMKLQAERDEMRKALAVINGSRAAGHTQHAPSIDWALDQVGFTVEEGHAHNNLMRYFRQASPSGHRFDGLADWHERNDARLQYLAEGQYAPAGDDGDEADMDEFHNYPGPGEMLRGF